MPFLHLNRLVFSSVVLMLVLLARVSLDNKHILIDGYRSHQCRLGQHAQQRGSHFTINGNPWRARSNHLQSVPLAELSNSVHAAIADEIIGWSKDFAKDFLENYWQKKPLLVRNALPKGFLNLQRDDLIELSTLDDVESRLLIKKGAKRWSKEYGPFSINEFDELKSKGNWTLLVQEVDRHIPAIADIWESHLSFVPEWRRDDVMISYANRDGGIGGHVDNYDVFLIQGRGSREWAIESRFITTTEEKAREVPRVDTRLLRNFQADQSWTMHEGDMLYLPPRVPHQGVALSDDCITVSMGFRAPSYRSMITALCERICSGIPEDKLYSDGGQLELQQSPGAIDIDARTRIASAITAEILAVTSNRIEMDLWLGNYLSTPLRMRLYPPFPFFLSGERNISSSEDVKEKEMVDDEDDEDLDSEETELSYCYTGKQAVASSRTFLSPEEVLSSFVDGSIGLRRAEGLKMMYIDDLLFIDGELYSLPKDTGYIFADHKQLNNVHFMSDAATTDVGATRKLLLELIGEGIFYPIHANS